MYSFPKAQKPFPFSELEEFPLTCMLYVLESKRPLLSKINPVTGRMGEARMMLQEVVLKLFDHS